MKVIFNNTIWKNLESRLLHARKTNKWPADQLVTVVAAQKQDNRPPHSRKRR